MFKNKCNGKSTQVSQSTHLKEGCSLLSPLSEENETLTMECTHWAVNNNNTLNLEAPFMAPNLFHWLPWLSLCGSFAVAVLISDFVSLLLH